MSAIIQFNARVYECIKLKHPCGNAVQIISSVVKRRSDYIYYSESLPPSMTLIMLEGVFLGGQVKEKGAWQVLGDRMVGFCCEGNGE